MYGKVEEAVRESKCCDCRTRRNLYAVGFSSDGYAALFRIKGDGSEWEISTKLYRTDYASANIWESPSVLINNGYVYFIDNKQTNMELERIPVGGGTAETVYEGDSHATFTDVHRLEGHDGAVSPDKRGDLRTLFRTE